MKLSVSMWSVEKATRRDDINQFDFIRWSDEQRIKYVELVSCFMRGDEYLHIKQELDNRGMKVSCYTILTNMVLPSADEWKVFERDLNVAQKLGAQFVRVTGGDSIDLSCDEAKKSIIANLRIAVQKAQQASITLILENVGPYTGRAVDVKQIVDAVNSPYLKVNFDIANCLLVEEDAIDSFKLLQDDIEYVHMKDFINLEHDQSSTTDIEQDDMWKIQPASDGTNYIGCAISDGEAPCLTLLDLLFESGYDGYLSIEYEGVGDFYETERSLKTILSKME